MAGSRCATEIGPDALRLDSDLFPARTPGPLGYLDAGDPDALAKLGDTPGPLGIHDQADPAEQRFRFIPQLNFQSSFEYQIFEEMVLSHHMKKAQRRRTRPFAAIPASQLEVVEDNYKLRKDAAKKCRALLSRARSDLAKEKADFINKSDKERQKEEQQAKANGRVSVVSVESIGITSAYRSFEHDSRLWHNYVRNKYYPTLYYRLSTISCWEGGPNGSKAADVLVDFVSKRKAAPGFSNHSNGIAVDFFTVENGLKLQANTDGSDQGLKAVNQRWEKSWFYQWLQKHKNEYGIERIPTEAWHWEFVK